MDFQNCSNDDCGLALLLLTAMSNMGKMLEHKISCRVLKT